MKEALSQAGIKFLVQDISTGMLPLKNFLKLRDTREEFLPMKEAERVGLPCLVIGNDKTIMFEDDNLPEIIEFIMQPE